MKYRKLPVIIEAVVWNGPGDHPNVSYPAWYDLPPFINCSCEVCGHSNAAHGWINTLEAGHRVCPGDWIITGVKGEQYPCKPDIFAQTYEAVLN